ncbi:hypothetical protein [Fibrella aquatica]|uniref:hypothetical protein n=1 Tax=Fibrella aquatica TaxID=3242487 RepID=UPI0035206680
MVGPVIDFTNFGTELLKTVEDMGGNIVIINSVMNGVAALRDDFDTEIIRDKGLLLSAEILDAFMPASDTFSGQKAMTLKTRTASFNDADIDLKITNDDIRKAYRSYLGWVLENGRTEAQVRENPFGLFFVNRIITQHFQFARTNTSWKGVFNQAGSGAGAITDGFLVKMTAGRAVGGDIAANHVFTAAASITDVNAYDQVNGVAQLVVDTRPDLLAMPMNFYVSQVNYDRYCRARRAAFPTFVGPGEKPRTLDERSNITFVIDQGLAGKDTMAVTPKQNLKFIANEAPGVYSINVVRQAKHWEISIRVSLGFDYASPELLFLNNKV